MDSKPILPPELTGPRFNIEALTSLGWTHYAQLLASMGLTSGASFLFGYLTAKGFSNDEATMITLSVCGLVVSFVWGVWSRIKLKYAPAPSQTVIQTTTVLPPGESVPAIQYSADMTGLARNASQTVTKAGKTLAMLLLVGLCIGGCATSSSFKTGMRVAGPLVADEAAAYTAGDGTLSTFDSGVQAAQAERLKTESGGECEYVEVRAAWNDVKPWYLRYVRQDQKLTDAERAIVLKTVDQVDGLIGEESKRRSLLFLSD